MIFPLKKLWGRTGLQKLMRRFACVVILTAGPAQAIVGPSQDPGPASGHVVMLLKRSANGSGFCSGTLIAPRIILTAAHCVGPLADMRVHYRDAVGKPVLLGVARTRVHPDFRPNAIKSRERSIDMALVEAGEDLDQGLTPVPMAGGRTEDIGTPFLVAGYGVTREGAGETSGVLRIARLQLRAPLSGILLWLADTKQQGTGACTGDSGGPILSGDGAMIVGVTAWSAGDGRHQCGSLTQATRVAPQREWIEMTLKEWGGQ